MHLNASIASSDITLLMIAENSLSTVLEHEGFRSVGVQTYVASGFSDVKKALGAYRIDAILIDWEYNYIDAFELVNYVRSSKAYKDLAIIVTSVHSCDDRLGKLNEHIDLFVRQPVPRVLLLERIRRLLNKKTREEPRVALEDFYLSSVKVLAGANELTMVLADVSKSGIFLYSETLLQSGQVVELDLSLPGIKNSLVIEGEVVRVARMHKINDKTNKGISIRFTKFLGNAEMDLDAFLQEHKPDSNFMSYYL